LDVLLVTNLAFLASIPERYAEEEVSIIINDRGSWTDPVLAASKHLLGPGDALGYRIFFSVQ